MKVFIVFVKFLGWIIVIWVRVARLSGEKGGLTTKMKYIIIKKKKIGHPLEPPLGFIPVSNSWEAHLNEG